LELRSQLGPSAFADLRAQEIENTLAKGVCPLVDAIFTPEEYVRVRKCGQNRSVLVAIEASFDTRSKRLLTREDRVHTAEQLRQRDETEEDRLHTTAVIEAADYGIPNERSLEEFQAAVDAVWTRLAR
jgi:dephospho-CoA kinase